MRNPAIFWGVMALLQVFWIIIALGAYWWLRPLLPKRPHPWLAILLTALVGNGLLLAFNTVLPEWRWRGTMAVLLFATYALMFTLMWTLVHTLLRWVVARRLLNRSIRVLVPVAWLAAIAAGLYGAYVPTVVHYQVKIDKPLAQPLRIALVSDTHLGRFIGARHLRELQTILKRERADVLLLAGDVMDDVPTVYRKQHMARLMSGLKTPLGQFAVLGNHDNYGGEQQGIVKDLQAAGFQPCALLMDMIFASDGILPPSAGLLNDAAQAARHLGAVVIADEVQTGFGRTGDNWWGFVDAALQPDIVTMGKPMGNGYPIAGVVASAELVATFAAKGRYFNTFGGNPVAVATGMAVLDELEQRQLPAKAGVLGQGLQAAFAGFRYQATHSIPP